jgi:hypothetical protein
MRVLARFKDENGLIAAVRGLRAEGVAPVESFSPYALEALEEGASPVPLIVFIAGISAFLASMGLQIYATTISYPINIGGRPLNSWLAYIPTAFENGILCAVLAGFLAFLFLSSRIDPPDVPGEGYRLLAPAEAEDALISFHPTSIEAFEE